MIFWYFISCELNLTNDIYTQELESRHVVMIAFHPTTTSIVKPLGYLKKVSVEDIFWESRYTLHMRLLLSHVYTRWFNLVITNSRFITTSPRVNKKPTLLHYSNTYFVQHDFRKINKTVIFHTDALVKIIKTDGLFYPIFHPPFLSLITYLIVFYIF